MTLTASARRACIIGHPVSQSRSPMIHGFWLRQLGLEGAYDRQDVPPADLPEALRSLHRRGYAGANITVPHKEAAFRLVDEATPRARSLQAVNTLWLEDGRLLGDNTDVAGFVDSLDATVPDWPATTRTATVIGAGGGARAVVAGLLDRGLTRIAVVNRSPDRADALARHFGNQVQAAPFAELARLLQTTHLLVNTTSLGMQGQPPLDIALDGLAPKAIVADIVYVPLETPLLAAARDRGYQVVDGLGMLLHQAAPAFERFFGQRPAITAELRALLERDISR
jgi:shikimate dehydrogenase